MSQLHNLIILLLPFLYFFHFLIKSYYLFPSVIEGCGFCTAVGFVLGN